VVMIWFYFKTIMKNTHKNVFSQLLLKLDVGKGEVYFSLTSIIVYIFIFLVVEY
jgi:hypothetical protein